MEPSQKPACRQCKHYYITWDPKSPYGCRKWGFKSALIPTRAVFNASGKECQVFEKK